MDCFILSDAVNSRSTIDFFVFLLILDAFLFKGVKLTDWDGWEDNEIDGKIPQCVMNQWKNPIKSAVGGKNSIKK